MTDQDWPDIESALVNWLPTVLEVHGHAVRAGTVLSLASGEHYVRVALTSNPDDGITQRATVDIDVFAPTRAVSYDLGKQVRRHLEAARSLDGVLVDHLRTVSGPKRVPWDNANTQRHLATYLISTRR